jgi:hypothetical protein
MRNRIPICVILLLATASVLFAAETEMQRFREEVEASRANMDVSSEEYEGILSKLFSLHDRRTSTLHRTLIGMGRGALLWIGCLMLIGLTLFFVQQIRRNLITEVRGNVTESEIDSVTTAQAALTQSEVAVTSHNFRDALRFLYLSAILHLQERGILTYDKSLTNLEYLHTLQAHVELQEALRPVIQVFDDVWYGYKPCNADTIANYRELLQKVYLTNG